MLRRGTSKYGAALSPVWEVLSPLLRESAQFKAISQAKFMTDPRRGLMRDISPDKVWRLCEVVEDPDGGLPRLKVHIPAFTELGIKQSGREASPAAFDGGAVRSS